MFISNAEKDSINFSINLIKGQIESLRAEIQELKAHKPDEAIEVVKKRKAYRPPPLVKTPEAPWGLKLDGTPRKRPGRPPFTQPTVNNEQPLFN
jgi:hypothetical protein